MATVYEFPEYYDILFGWDRDDEAGEYRDALRQWGVHDRADVLEIAAGTAQVGIRLAACGYRVTALDTSAAMLEYATNAARRADVLLATIATDMTAFRSGGSRFDAAVNPMSSFRLLQRDEEVQAHLDCMTDALPRDGLYLLDMTFGTDGSPATDLDEWVMARGDVVVAATPLGVTVVDRPHGVDIVLDWHEALRSYTDEEFSSVIREHSGFAVEGCYRTSEAEPNGTSKFGRELDPDLPAAGRAIVVVRRR